MSKFCPNCGKELADDAITCTECGKTVTATTSNVASSGVMVTNRNIALAVILSLVTFGIYGIYWYVKLTDEANHVSNNTAPTGLTAFLLTLVTCGLYGIYWGYQMGKKMYEAGKIRGKDISDNSVLYLVLSLFGLAIVNYCLIQNDLNKFAE